MKKIILGIISISLLLFPLQAQQVGNSVPDFTLNTLDHGQISISQYQGKVVFLSLFGFG